MIKAIVFDLDGTLTRPTLSFKTIRDEIGVDESENSLLDQIAAMPPAERARAEAILSRYEAAAVLKAELNQGVRELFAYLAARGFLCAIVTRNTDLSTQQVISKLGLSVHRVITRDSGLPLKPDPASLASLLREWKLEPNELLMVGDYRYDIEAGRSAAALTCLITNGRETENLYGADYQVSFPGDLIGVLEEIGIKKRR